jgi:hypothetical protein
MYLLATLAPLVARLLILPWDGIPFPVAHDEFTHLLVADTLCEGRLANPPHPMARYLETNYVLQHPAYAAKYPIGIGIFLAIGQLAGHAWVGVLLADMLAGAAFFWCLLAALPAEWALAGALLGGVRYLGLSYWSNSYWGGAAAALAGALLLGGLLRWLERPAARPALIGALGWSLLWLIRPFESLVLAMTCLLGLLAWQIRGKGAPAQTWLRCLVLPFGVVALATLALTLAHNRAVTGMIWRLPYQQAQIEQGVPQGFIFQQPVARPELEFKDQREVYEWQLEHRLLAGHWPDGLALTGRTVLLTFGFYCGLTLLITVLLGIVRPITQHLETWAYGALVLALAGMCLYPFPLVHYLAGYCVVALFVITAAARRVLDRRCISRMMRVAAFTCVVVLSTAEYMWTMGPDFGRVAELIPSMRARHQLSEQLARQPGRHLVLVHYSPQHDNGAQWIYNRANIDAAKVVWARDISPTENRPLLDYFRNRQVWRVEADAAAPTLERVN